MPRKQPDNPNDGRPWPPEVNRQSHLTERTIKLDEETEIIVQARRYKLITPLFGGGVEPGVNDLDNLIRATGIRGQLRFWWRAIRGGQFGDDLAKLKAREDEIWGAASHTERSQKNEQREDKPLRWQETVQLQIEILQSGQSIKPFKIVPKKQGGYKADPDNGIPGYAAFPLRPEDGELKKLGMDTPLITIQQNVEFMLYITFPALWEEDVLAALWAWETFGGIGARSRRGFGALLPKKNDGKDIEEDRLPPSEARAAKAWIQAKIRHHSGKQGEHPANVPCIKGETEMRVIGPNARPALIWGQLIDTLRRFRQPRIDAQSGQPLPYGKSPWPEADALRKRLHVNSDDASDKFPRAAFGLPIVFHLAHEHPVRTLILQGATEGAERWASRLILKPIPCHGGQYLGLALILGGSVLQDSDLNLMENAKLWKTIAKKQTEIKAGELSRLRDGLGIGNETDILRAFLNYLKKEETRQ